MQAGSESELNAVPRREIVAAVHAALTEDLGDGDVTAALLDGDESRATASVVSREEAVLCGTEWFDEVFRQVDSRVTVDWHRADGDSVGADDSICSITGPVAPILTGERTALNFLQTLSGTATATRRYADAVADTGARILDTRKTLPGLRVAQKYAVSCGGGTNHRIGLFDAFLIKENHIAAAGSLRAIVAKAVAEETGKVIEVEVENLEQVAEALDTGAHRLLLDNFTIEQTIRAVTLRNERAPDKELEASGNVTLDTIRRIAETGVDWISVGAITKDVDATDFSLLIE